jgi:hypothetical protein
VAGWFEEAASRRISEDTGRALGRVLDALSDGVAEGGDAEAQRSRVTGWSQVAEAPEADTDTGVAAGGRKVVGTPSLSVQGHRLYSIRHGEWAEDRHEGTRYES